MDEMIAQLLVTEGFSTIQEVAFVPIEELASIEGFDAAVCNELQERSRQYLEVRETELIEMRKKAGVSDEVANIEGLTGEMLVELGQNDIKTLDELADLASDELMGMVGENVLSEENANAIIMGARAHWFEDAETDVSEHENMVAEEDAKSPGENSIESEI